MSLNKQIEQFRDFIFLRFLDPYISSPINYKITSRNSANCLFLFNKIFKSASDLFFKKKYYN